MKKNKIGFTLVELLAVIVILSIIAIITVPMIMNVIDKAKKSSFEQSIKGIENSIELDIIDNDDSILHYNIVNGLITNAETSKILSTKGGNNLNGEVKVKKDGTIIYAINNGEECIIKRDGQEDIEHIKNIDFCTMEVATNLVINGYGEYEDNTNFKSFTYENGEFIYKSNIVNKLFSNQFIEVNNSKKYYYAVDVKSNNLLSNYYSGLYQYDYDKNEINVVKISYIQNTLTTLAKDLNDGDTIVYFTDLSHPYWHPSAAATASQLGLIFWNYKNSIGYEYPELTYSNFVFSGLYNYEDVSPINGDNTIKLKKPWSKGLFKAGTKVSRSSSNGSSYSYGLIEGKNLTSNYQSFSNISLGIKDWTMNKNLSSATKYIRFYVVDNYNNTHDTITYYKNIIIREIDE